MCFGSFPAWDRFPEEKRTGCPRNGLATRGAEKLVVQEEAWQPEVQRNWLSKKWLGNQREGKGLRDLVSWV